MGQAMKYVLHYAPDNASLIIRLALEYIGVPYKTQLVDRAARAQDGPDYRALNPNGLIPVLETPQGALFETGAILLWLADRHGGLGLAPDARERGDFLKWLFFIANTVHPAMRMLFYPDKYVGADPSDHATLRRGLQEHLKTSFATLDDIAATRPSWLSPEQPTMLNFYLAACLRWCALYPSDTHHGWFALDDTPHLHSLCAALESLPCCTVTRAAEGLGEYPFTKPDYPNPPEGSAT